MSTCHDQCPEMYIVYNLLPYADSPFLCLPSLPPCSMSLKYSIIGVNLRLQRTRINLGDFTVDTVYSIVLTVIGSSPLMSSTILHEAVIYILYV